MALPSSGRISLSQVATQFGFNPPYAMSSLYDQSICYTPSTVNPVPTGGNTIGLSNFYGKANVIPTFDSAAGGIPGVKGFYSLKRLRKNYAGPVMELVRYSDSATANVYADVDGVKGLSFNGRGTPLSEWLGAGNAYVKTWYDQGSVGNHAVQANVTLSPILKYAECQTLDFRTSRYFSLPDNTIPPGTNWSTLGFKHGNVQEPASCTVIGAGRIASGQYQNDLTCATSKYGSVWNNSSLYSNTSTLVANNRVLVCYQGSSTVRKMYINGKLHLTPTTLARTASSTMANYIGTSLNDLVARAFNGDMYFVYIIQNDASSLGDAVVQALSV